MISQTGNGIDGTADDDDDSISITFPFHDAGTTKRLNVKWYRFKPSLSFDMERADLILCHAGAGTLLEALALPTAKHSSTTTEKNLGNTQTNLTDNHRVINAVINTKLMDNHQSELAEELERRNHILVTREVEEWATINGAQEFWDKVINFHPQPFRRGCGMCQNDGTYEFGASNFQNIVDRVMGL